MILNKKELGKLALLKYLLEQSGYVYKESMLAQFNISLSTLKRYTQSMNEDLASIKEFRHIKIIDREGYYFLENTSPFNGQYVLKKVNLIYHKESIQFQLFQKLFSCSDKSLTSLKTSLHISLPYMYKLLFSANQFLKPFLIKIDYSMNLDSFTILGNSTNVRLFETYFFWSIHQGIEWPFENISMDELYSSFSAKQLESIFSVSTSKQLKYLYSLAISHKLYATEEKELTLEDEFKETLLVFQTTYDLSQPLDHLLRNHEAKTEPKNLETERLFFNFTSRVFSSYRDSKEIQNEIGEKLFTLENSLIHYCKKLLASFVSAFPEIKLLPDYEEFNYQFLYFFSLYFANIFYIQFDSSNLQEFMVINPDVHTIDSETLTHGKKLFSQFLKENPLPKHRNISEFHLTLAHGLIYYFTSKMKDVRLAIYIHFSKDMFGASYIEAELYKLFGRENILIVDTVDQSDIIISDFYEDRYKNEKYFHFDDIKNKAYWRKLYTFVHEHQLKELGN